MSHEPLSGEHLDHVRDGDAAREPCHDCGVHPVYRHDDQMYHYFHREGCSVPERIRRLIEEG